MILGWLWLELHLFHDFYISHANMLSFISWTTWILHELFELQMLLPWILLTCFRITLIVLFGGDWSMHIIRSISMIKYEHVKLFIIEHGYVVASRSLMYLSLPCCVSCFNDNNTVFHDFNYINSMIYMLPILNILLIGYWISWTLYELLELCMLWTWHLWICFKLP